MTADPSLDDFVASRRREDNLPGVALALVADGEVVACRAWGVADLASGAPLGQDAAFRAGSLTKLVTAATALRLVERRVVGLDEPVLRYVPWLAARAAGGGPADLSALTLRHLLAHGSGLPRGPYGMAPRSTEERLRDLAGMALAFPPGERSKYSNLGYALAAHVLAQAAGRPYHELARELVLAPAGMDGAGFGAPATSAGGLATGHQRGHYRSLVRRGDRLEPAPDLPAAEGAGDLVASARDLARLANALLPGRLSLLSAASWAEVTRPPVAAAPGARPFGLALRLGRRFGRPCLEQDAGHSGFFALLRIFPADGVAGVALANRCSAYYPVSEILDRALAPLLAAGGRPAERGPADDLGRYAGDYRSPAGALRVRLAAGRLELEHGGEAIPLTRHGRGHFIQERGPFSDHLARFAFSGAAGIGAWELTAGPRLWGRAGAGPASRWEAAPSPDPAFGARAGIYHRPGYGDARVYERAGRLWLSMHYAEEEELLPAGDGTFRLAGGGFVGEPVEFETAAGEAAALEAGSMRFVRR